MAKDIKILVIGACGQIGCELITHLRAKYGTQNVIGSDIKNCHHSIVEGKFEIADATDKDALARVIKKYNIEEVYLMAAMLSVTAEKYPVKAWEVNMVSLFNVLNLAKEGMIKKVFWPSSIAVFGHTTPKNNTPQLTIMEPTTVYGISKQAGERWCAYYNKKYNVDVRSVRYPGIISYKTRPGGGTTDYAVEIFHHAIKYKKYHCFLKKDTALPMMFMDDAIRATIDLMAADLNKPFTSYNIAGISFTPKELAAEIKKHLPDFAVFYKPDFRQNIADSWPNSIDDSEAVKDWKWEHQTDLKKLTAEMLQNLM
ncbi:MAG: NAD-dependent epimerase [Flavobacteriales bacterium]|nr:MAG: NAD-dependent epimerase [Flavobacteriales bacterium]